MRFTKMHLVVGGAAALVVAIGVSIVLGNLPDGGAGADAEDAALLYHDGRALPADFPETHAALAERIHAELETRYGITADQLYDEDARPDGYRVVLTLDKALQDAADETAAGRAGVVAIEPGTGAVLCYAGTDPDTGADLVGPASPHPPSSVFDMITAATALEAGASIESWWSDDELDVTLAQAVSEGRAGAMDTVAGEYGVETVLQTANGMGLTAIADADGNVRDLASGDFAGLTAADLGTYPVPVVDMASVYATIASGGTYAETHFVGAVLDAADREVEPERAVRTAQALAETTAQDLQYIGLGESEAIEDRDFFGVAADYHGQTTESWFVGAIPQLSVAAWANGAAAEDGGVALWRNVIGTAIEVNGYEAEELPGASGAGEDLTEGLGDDGSIDPDSEYCRANPDEPACAASDSPSESASESPSEEPEETTAEPEPDPTTSEPEEPDPTTSEPEETTSECNSWPFC
ncbi:serine hydrolase family protein [Glycomyces terrestris]|uniref:penicillin-binding transpeptidase domain-containing protein n=1 Tax=Glycomyces terrestris TaxID=2493553 RepID=UPI00131573A9|nr:penicillin-binding transpeptidase domain-containing protein [Glycomyces terrestris]